jgi:hypothetical protein
MPIKKSTNYKIELNLIHQTPLKSTGFKNLPDLKKDKLKTSLMKSEYSETQMNQVNQSTKIL